MNLCKVRIENEEWRSNLYNKLFLYFYILYPTFFPSTSVITHHDLNTIQKYFSYPYFIVSAGHFIVPAGHFIVRADHFYVLTGI